MRRGITKKEPSSDLESLGIGGGFAVKGRSKNLTGVMMIKATYSVLTVVVQDTPKMSALNWWVTQTGGRM